MKYTAQLQRRSSRRTGPGISLFPFLAVLICTMGALVPLLVAITRTARQQAESAALAKAAEQSTEVQSLREDAQWRTEQLKQSRQCTQAQLAEARLQLGHLEDHSRRLRDKLKEYEKAETDLNRLETDGRQRVVQSQAELDQIRSKIGEAQQTLAETRKASAGRNRSYAVVPYDGPNQTRRRPIYIECLADSVVIQPESIELTVADFEGPMGPGNPLASALRAAREYMLAQRDFNPQAGEPYPLLLVRPEGISAYYAARTAMKSWGGDFGYELIDNDWKLAFQPPDARLAEVVRQVIASARVNQERLIAAAPRHYGNRSKVAYRVSPSHGGIIREGVSPEDDEGSYRPAGVSGPVGRNEGSGFGGQGSGGGAQGIGGVGQGIGSGGQGTGIGGQGIGSGGLGIGSGAQGAGGGGQGIGSGGGTYASVAKNEGTANGSSLSPGGENFTGPSLSAEGNVGNGGVGTSGNPCRPFAERWGTGVAGESANKYVTNSSQGVSPQDASGGSVSSATSPHPNSSFPRGEGTVAGSSDSHNAQPNSGGTVERPEGYVVGQPPHEHEASNQKSPSDDEQASSKMVQGRIMRPGEWEPAPEPPPKHHDEKDDKHDKKGDHQTKSLAEKRGPNWGLRDASRGSVGVTRTIRIDCYADRLVVVSERGPAGDKTIMFGPQTETSINALVSTVWERIEAWGIAGRGMYWRPQLHVHVAPDAEDRFMELSTLLEGSGLTVERK